MEKEKENLDYKSLFYELLYYSIWNRENDESFHKTIDFYRDILNPDILKKIIIEVPDICETEIIKNIVSFVDIVKYNPDILIELIDNDKLSDEQIMELKNSSTDILDSIKNDVNEEEYEKIKKVIIDE
jgi:hypothetical protein